MGKKSVLIVDSDQDVLSHLAHVLGDDGWEVLPETDGDWALKTFQSRQVDAVVVCDVLSVMSGYHVVAALRSLPKGKDVPLVMLSQDPVDPKKRQETVENYGLLELLDKPIQGALMKSVLEEHFGDEYPLRGDGTRRNSGDEEVEVRGVSAATQAPGVGAVGRDTRRQTLSWLEAFLEDEESGEVGQGVGGKPEERERGGGEGGGAGRFVGLGRVGLHGNLRHTDFPRVLREVSRVQATGALFILKDTVKKIVHVRNGVTVSVKSNLLRECLGQMLVQEGRISEHRCRESLVRMKRSGRLQGAELMEMGVLNGDEVAEALRRQLELKLLGVFGYDGGLYSFKENVQRSEQELVPQTSLATLLYRGVMAATPIERVEETLWEEEGAFLTLAEDPFCRCQVMEVETDEERAWLDAVDGSRRLGEWLSEYEDRGREVTERLHRFLYAGLCAGVFELWGVPVNRGKLVAPGSLLGAEHPRSRSVREAQKLLSDKLSELQQAEVTGILGSGVVRGEEGLDQAFVRVAAKYHPDHFLEFGAGPQELAEALFEVYRETYRNLKATQVAQATQRAQAAREDEKKEKPGGAESEGQGGTHVGVQDADRAVSPPRNPQSVESGEARPDDETARRPKRRRKPKTGGTLGMPRIPRPLALDAAEVALGAAQEFESGLALEAKKRWSKAVGRYLRAVEMKPTRGDYRAQLAWALLNANPRSEENEAKAEEELARAVDGNPSLAQAYLYRGHLLERRKDLDGARKEFQKALHRNPRSREAAAALKRLGPPKGGGDGADEDETS